MNEHKMFDVTLTTLTPLHIGTGRDLLHEYDYEMFDRKTWVINQAALLEAKATSDDPRAMAILAVTPPTRLLEDEDFDESRPWFRYVIKGQPRSNAEGAQVMEQFKNVFNQPYLPGSSLKGALRTVIGWHAWQQKGMSPDASRLNDRAKFAAGSLEKEIFGRDPNNDMFRALQVSDSDPVEASSLLLLNARILNPGGALSAPVEMEAIRGDTVFNLTMKLDLALFSDWARRYGLRLGGKQWLEELAAIAQAHSQEQIAAELEWARQVPNGGRLAGTYETFRKAPIGKNQFLLRLGWGTGWDDKTFGSRLKEDDDFMEYIIPHYNMAKGKHARGEAFPRSRRAAVSFSRSADGAAVETPAAPLGWVLVEMSER